MSAAIVAFFAFLASSTARFLAEKVIMFLAFKAFLTVLCVVVLPIVLNNVIGSYLNSALASMSSINTSAYAGGEMGFIGFTGWLLDVFQIPAILAIVISAYQMHITLRFIPFSPIK